MLMQPAAADDDQNTHRQVVFSALGECQLHSACPVVVIAIGELFAYIHPPAIGPTTGPRMGAKLYIPIAFPRWSGVQISL